MTTYVQCVRHVCERTLYTAYIQCVCHVCEKTLYTELVFENFVTLIVISYNSRVQDQNML